MGYWKYFYLYVTLRCIQIKDIIETNIISSQEISIVKHTIVYIIMIKFVQLSQFQLTANECNFGYLT